MTQPRGYDPYAALRLRNYRLFLAGSVSANVGMQMLIVAVGWDIYERTGSAMALGWIGLVQVLPVIGLALISGHVADRFDRRRIMMVALTVIALGSLGLAWESVNRSSIRGIYVLLLLRGTARAFLQPARASFMPLIVPRESFQNAVTWNTGGFQMAAVLGPAIGGALIALFRSATLVYLLEAMSAAFFVVALMLISHKPVQRRAERITLRSLGAGFGFLWNAPVIFGAITLDLFAVLLGGAETLLPIYAKDILHVGPTGLGWMRAAPAIGALGMAFLIAHRPPMQRAGRALLWSVAAFGVATILFGISRWYWLSLLMLVLIGAFDNVSVVIRHTLVQILTPDAMRGRVSAINGMFINASNELGGFESGLVAALLSPTLSVVTGGVGTLVIVASVTVLCPPLRRYGRLGDPPP